MGKNTERKESNEIKPKGIWITVNRNCNMRCSWCYAKGSKYCGEMDINLAKKIAQITIDCGIKKIFIIGGEPTIWKHLFSFNRFCKEKGIKTTLVTNGLRFSDDIFWKDYKKNPNDSAGISLKAFDEDSYKKITGVSNFKAVVTGLERGLKFFNCGISAVSSSSEPKELIKIANFSKSIGANHLNIGFCTPIITKKGIISDFMASPGKIVSNLTSVYEEINSLTEGKISFSMKLPLCIWPKEFIELLILRKQISTSCQLRSRSGLIFGLLGEVILCNTLFEYPVGKFGEDFFDANGLIKFLNNPSISNYYKRMGNYPSEKCISCDSYPKCGGGCAMMWSVYKPAAIIK